MNTPAVKDYRSPRRTHDISLHAGDNLLRLQIYQSIVGFGNDAKAMIFRRHIGQVIHEGNVSDFHTPIIISDQISVPTLYVLRFTGWVAKDDSEFLETNLLANQASQNAKRNRIFDCAIKLRHRGKR